MDKEQQSIFVKPIEPNIEVQFGDTDPALMFTFGAKKNIVNRLKFWLLCRFFPYKIRRWN